MSKIKTLLGGIILSAILCQPTMADTVITVTEFSYDSNLRLLCTAQRMDRSTFANAAADACTVFSATNNSFGPDRITQTAYDAVGQVIQVKRAFGTSIVQTYATYGYDLNGNIVDSIDANGNRTHITYDGLERLDHLYYPAATPVAAFNPSTQAAALSTAGAYNSNDYEAFDYDLNGNRCKWRRRNGFVFLYKYDALDRTKLESVPTASVDRQCGETITGTAKDIYTSYDLLGHVLSKRFGSPTGTGVGYIYDGFGRVSSTTDIFNRGVGYSYNQASSLITIGTGAYWANYTRDSTERVTRIDDGLGTVLAGMTYDDLGQRKSLSKGPGNVVSYLYDAVGRLTSQTNDLAGTANDVTYGFSYSPATQISAITTSNDVFDYKEVSHATDNRTYNGLNQDSAIAALAGGYDANGNLGNDGGRAMTYDVYNRLLGMTGTGIDLSLSYDPEGRLSQYTSNGTTTQFLYEGTNLVAELDISGAVLRHYVHGTGVDEPLIWYEGSGTSNPRYFVQNYQGSVIGYTDTAGNINPNDVYKYGPWGEPKNAADADSWLGSRFRYTGQTMIPEARLYYYKARVYDPVFGQFLQTDPVGSKDDLDLYAYVGGDPVNKTDPDGQQTVGPMGAEVGPPLPYDDPAFQRGQAEVVDDFRNDIANDPLGFATDVVIVAVDILDFPSGEAVPEIAARRAAAKAAREAEQAGLRAERKAVHRSNGKKRTDTNQNITAKKRQPPGYKCKTCGGKHGGADKKDASETENKNFCWFCWLKKTNK